MRVRSQKGFTLLELLVVVVIVGVLAAAAVPIYLNYVKDSRRAEAKGGLAAIQTAEQTYFQANGTYTATLANLSVDLTDSQANWTFALTAGDATHFTATARGKGTSDYPASLGADLTYTRGSGGVLTDVG